MVSCRKYNISLAIRWSSDVNVVDRRDLSLTNTHSDTGFHYTIVRTGGETGHGEKLLNLTPEEVSKRLNNGSDGKAVKPFVAAREYRDGQSTA